MEYSNPCTVMGYTIYIYICIYYVYIYTILYILYYIIYTYIVHITDVEMNMILLGSNETTWISDESQDEDHEKTMF